MNTCIPELVNLGNDLAAHGDSLGADICRRVLTEIEHTLTKPRPRKKFVDHKPPKLPGERLSSTQTPPDLAAIAAKMQAPRDSSGGIVRFPESLPEAPPAPLDARLEAVERGQKKLEQCDFWQDIALAILFGAWFVLAWRVFL